VTETPEPDQANPETAPRRPPAPLLVAASVVAVEAVLVVMQAVVEIVAFSGQRLVMGLTTTLFFLLYGAGLLYCAWAVSRLRSWGRAPIVVAQLIQLAVAWSFAGGSTTFVAVTLTLLAVLVLVGIFHPASIAALGDDEV